MLTSWEKVVIGAVAGSISMAVGIAVKDILPTWATAGIAAAVPAAVGVWLTTVAAET